MRPALLLAAVLAVAADPPPNPVVAKVGDAVIRLDQVDAVIKARPAAGPVSAVQLRRLRAEVAADLVDDLLVRHYLLKHGPPVDPAETDAQMKALADGLAAKGTTLAAALRANGQTEADLRAEIDTQTRLGRHVRERVTDDQLLKYYLANKDHFDRAEVRVSRILVRTGPQATAVERAAAREKLQAVRADIAAGKVTFADAARKHSQCPFARAGGDLGFIPRRGSPVDEPFARAAFALRVGQVSEVVEADAGVGLMVITARNPGTPSTFATSREEVRETFADDYRQELVTQLRAVNRVEITIP